MSRINIIRTAQPMPDEAALAGARSLLFEAFDGLGDVARKSWRRFWGRAIKLEPGEMMQAELVIPRNAKFLRKFFALLDVGYDAWEPGRKHKTYKGREVLKNRERFRKDIIIMAGFYEQTFDIRGRMQLEAKSISFANMGDAEFEQLYNATADVLLREVLKNYAGRDELDAVVDRIIGFVG